MAANANRWELKPESLRAVCNPDSLGFETTLELTPLKEKVVAQDRAVHALEFGLGVKDLEYNIFVAGPPRAGKTETIMGYLAELAAKDPSPSDYIYIYNFRDPEKPQSLNLPKGLGRVLKADMGGTHLHPASAGPRSVRKRGLLQPPGSPDAHYHPGTQRHSPGIGRQGGRGGLHPQHLAYRADDLPGQRRQAPE